MIDDTIPYLQSLDEGIQGAAWSFVANWRRRGIPFVIISGRRSVGGNQEVAGASASWHLTGLAFDGSIWLPTYGHVPRDWIPFWWWEALAAPWEAAGGRWGGRFAVPDVNHFDAGGPARF